MATVLIVEDDPIAHLVMRQIVDSIDLEILTANDANEAWELLRRHPEVSLVISDCLMGDTDGRDLVANMRSSTQWCKTPIIMVSSCINYKDVADMLEQGVSRFLPKPVQPVQLIRYVRCLLDDNSHSVAS